MKLLAIMAAGAIAAGNLMADEIEAKYERIEIERQAWRAQFEMTNQIEKNTKAVEALTESHSGNSQSHGSYDFSAAIKLQKMEEEFESRRAEYQKAKMEREKFERWMVEHAK